MYVTYILYSPKLSKYYTGSTSNLSRRLEEHNRGKTPFMFSGLPWELVYQKEFSTRSASVNHEREIKKRGALRYLTDLEKLSG